MICAVEGYYVTSCLTRLWSTQAKVEGNVRKATWHSGSNSSIVNEPTGEPGRTPIYVGLPSAWVPWTVNICLPTVS